MYISRSISVAQTANGPYSTVYGPTGTFTRGGEWYLEKHVSWKVLARSRNLGSVFYESRSLVFCVFFWRPRVSNFLPKVSESRNCPFPVWFSGVEFFCFLFFVF